jgi:hypothetical protein
MLAGGLPTRGYNPYDSTHWFHLPFNQDSNTWGAADWQNSFFSSYQNTQFKFQGSPDQLQAGDVFIMQFSENTFPTHARVIVGWGYSEEGVNSAVGTWGLLANQHTEDRKRILWSDPIPPNTLFWPWHISY